MRTTFTRCIFIFLSLLAFTRLQAQQAWFRPDTVTTVSVGGQRMLNPWAGGLNASQFLKMHLNNDSEEDLVVYDRTNSKVTTFIAAADPANAAKEVFLHAPTYEGLFPRADNWMILADYNGDGLKDLFTSTSLGITVYKQEKSGNNWSFRLMRDVLYTKGFSGNINMQVSGTDIPGITDIDDDGDLDLLTFDFSGTYIELHQNLSMERFGVADSLGTEGAPVFMRNGDCWGNFQKGDSEGFVFGQDCGVVADSGARVMHAGNSILLQDLNGDGKKDLLAGHVSNEHISFLTNNTSGLAANFTAYTNVYPTVDPVLMHIFPAAFMEDVDFDGVKDLLIAPSIPANDINLTDFKSSGWYYHNAGTSTKPVFQLKQKNFLQDQMIDVGENAAPSFFDIDGDGDLDILVGTGGNPTQNGFRGSFWLLRNDGTAAAPAYVVVSQDYLNISTALGLYNLKPQWADFNGDGAVDLGFTATNITNLKLEYRYIPNKAAAGAAPQFALTDAVTITLPTELQTGDSPYFFDADGDGDLDLLVGKTQGNIFYFTNTGSKTQYTFKLETDAFAGININFAGRLPQLAVADMDLDGRADLVTVDHTGNLKIFHSADWGKWTERETQLVQISAKAANPNFGTYLALAVADWNGDKKPDVAIGTNAGGLRLLTNILPVTVTGIEPGRQPVIHVYPNPSKDYIRVSSSENGTLNIYTSGGRKVLQNQRIGAHSEREIVTANWSAGLYLIELQTAENRVVKKVVIE